MENTKKKFGLPTGIAMVVGIVIGSGVFVKAGTVLEKTGGNLALSLLAWLIGGLIMVVCGFCFGVFASKVTKYNGVIDYVEMSSSRRVGYILTWLFTTLYYPIVASIVACFASAYFIRLTGLDTIIAPGTERVYQLLGCWQTYLIAFGFIVLFFVMNYFAPKISAKFQISATIIKLVPILIIVIVGLFAKQIGIGPGIGEAFKESAEGYVTDFGGAIKATTFAYEGWVCATSINAEIKDSKKNLPRALMIGTIAVVAFYLIYFMGVSAVLTNQGAIEQGWNAPLQIFYDLFKGVAGEKIFTVLILVSCLGTVNGVCTANARGLYTMSCRGMGPWAKQANKVNSKTGMSPVSCLFGFGCAVVALGLWYLANNEISFFKYLGSMDEIVCSIIYGCYIFMFVYMIRNFKDLNPFKRFVMPVIAILGCCFFIFCGTGLYSLIFNQSKDGIIGFAIWMLMAIVITVPCLFFYKKEDPAIKVEAENNNTKKEESIIKAETINTKKEVLIKKAESDNKKEVKPKAKPKTKSNTKSKAKAKVKSTVKSKK